IDYTVNKVCASATKAIMLAAINIELGLTELSIAGGFESMTNAPYYLEKARFGYKLGHGTLIDGMVKDGLWDVYNDIHMATAAEAVAKELEITRKQQDEYCIRSYQRATKAWESGWLNDEVFPVEVKIGKETKWITEDEEFRKVKYEKIESLPPAFQKDGTITAANASTINDGGVAFVLASAKKAEALGIQPIAWIRGFGDAAQKPERFPTSPSLAIPRALAHAGFSLNQMDTVEIHEAFSAVALANMKQLGIGPEITNLHGGAVSLGHPLGATGGRIITSLISVLRRNGGKRGVVGVCNGGGGASAMVLELA
ncbi:MAG: acetyl-CoA C-acyltransferase, partial [Bacteroidia bacterium]|nr:acetyl-CoA C-acyltransferase [Bacteroidia bacterium]